MLHQLIERALKIHGPEHELAYVLFTPAASPAAQVLTEAQSVQGVSRTSAGLWVVTFTLKPKAIIPINADHIENDTTTYHFVRTESLSVANGTATISHKSVAYASVASGPAASDTVDQIFAAFLLRKYS